MYQSVQSLSCVWLFVTPWTPACHASLSITNSQSLLKLMSIELVMKSNHLILCLSRSPPAFNLSQNWGLFQVVRSSYQAAKVLELQLHHQSFQLNIQDRFPWRLIIWCPCSPRDSLKSLLQHQSSRASILWCSAFFIVKFSHPYMTTGKNIALTRRTFVGKVMSLLINMQSKLVIAFLQGASIF